MVVFNIHNSHTAIEGPDHLVLVPIDKFFRVKRDGYVKSIDWQEYRETGRTIIKTKYKPQYIDLYNPIRKSFPTGRLGYVVEWLDTNNIAYQLNDCRKKPERHLDITYIGPPADGSNGFPPRPYQLNAPVKIEEHGGRGILWHATASGKTATASRIIAHFGVRTLYIVPSLELLNQTQSELNKMLKTADGVGRIGDGDWDPRAVTVSTAQTLWARFERPETKELLNNTEMLILDEAHHTGVSSTKDKNGNALSLNSWYILALNCNAYYRIGLTGTPGKDIDQKRVFLESMAGRVIDRVSARELIDLGIISDVEIHIHTIKHKQSRPDFNSARKEGVITNEPFNDYLVQVAISEIKQGKNVLILTNSKEHQGPLLVSLFERYGMSVPFVSGESKSKERERLRQDFKEGRIPALIGTIYKEGVDFPRCDCGILADGGQDEKRTLQFLGRVLRKAQGKGIARLHDFNHKDGKYLHRHSAARLGYFVEEELDRIVTHKGIEI